MIRPLSALGLCVPLMACATGGLFSSPPTPDTVKGLLGGIEGGYAGDCLLQPGVSWCSKSAQHAAAVCKATADQGLAVYTEAYNTHNLTQAVLDNEATLLPALIGCVGKIKGK